MQSARVIGIRYGGREAFALFRRLLSPAEDAESAFREFMERHQVPAWLFDHETRKSRRIPPGDWQARRRLWCSPGEASIKVKRRATARAITLRKIKAAQVSDNSVYGWQARYRFWFSPDSGLGGYRDTWPWIDGEVRIDQASFDQALKEMRGRSVPKSSGKLQRGAAPRLKKVIAWLKDRIETWPDDVPMATERQDLEAARDALGDVRRAQLRAAVKTLDVPQSWRKPGPRSPGAKPAG